MTRSYKNTISTFVPQRLRIIISTKPPQEYKEFLKVKDKQNGRTLLQDTVENMKKANDSSYSALNEDDFQRVVFENKLGCDVYLKKKLEDSENIIELLQHESKVSLLLLPPRFSDKLNVLSNSTESRYYVVVQIFESKVVLELVSFCKCIYFILYEYYSFFSFSPCQGLPIIDDGNGHSYFCALRLLIGSHASDQLKLKPDYCLQPALN